MTGHVLVRPLALVVLLLLTFVAVVSCGTADHSAKANGAEPAVRHSIADPLVVPGPASAGTNATNAAATPVAQSISAVAATGTPTVVGTPAANPTEQAIQTIILNNNLAQMQAFASGNPSLMQNNATSSFYQEMVKSNQQLANAGATSVQLVKLVWGPISVQGTTAQATTYETWLTTYNDGTTELQESDKNVYGLVHSGGQWLINADKHPNDTSPAAAGGPSAHRPTPTPIGTPVNGTTALPSANTSRNWSGYSTTNGPFTSVTGTWQVPHVDAESAGRLPRTRPGLALAASPSTI